MESEDASYHVDIDQLSYRLLDGEAVVIHLGTSVYYGLNQTATSVWEHLVSAPASVDVLAAGFASAHGIEADVAARDLDSLFATLIAEELVIAGTPASGPDPTWEPTIGPYVAPVVDRYDKLEQLMLSGE